MNSIKKLYFNTHPQTLSEQSKLKGFTIVELLVVIVVIGILAAITIISYTGISSRAVTASVKSDISQAYKQLEVSKTTSSTDVYPTDLNTANLKSSNGTTYTYYSDSPYKSYCLAATNNSTVYSVSSSNPTPISGNCLSNGLVGYWALDNTTGMTDLSGNGNNGTAYGTMSIGTAANHLGTANKATAFDGSDDYVEVGGATSLNITNEFTISAWYRSIDGNYGVLGNDYPNIILRGSFRYFLGFHSNYIVTWTNNDQHLAGSAIVPNQWTHVVWTHSVSSNDWRLYVMGVSVASRTASAPISNSNTTSMGVYGGRYFNGSISDVRIYNRALSQTEITNLYNSN